MYMTTKGNRSSSVCKTHGSAGNKCSVACSVRNVRWRNRNAVAASSPGLPSSATLGKRDSRNRQPQRGCGARLIWVSKGPSSPFPKLAEDDNPGLWTQPRCGCGARSVSISQGSRGRQPWAGGRNRVAVCSTRWGCERPIVSVSPNQSLQTHMLA